MAGDCCGGGRQEERRFGALGNGGESFQRRRVFFGLKRRIRIRTTGKLSADQSGRNCVDTNLGRESASERFGHGKYTGFGGCVDN